MGKGGPVLALILKKFRKRNTTAAKYTWLTIQVTKFRLVLFIAVIKITSRVPGILVKSKNGYRFIEPDQLSVLEMLGFIGAGARLL